MTLVTLYGCPVKLLVSKVHYTEKTLFYALPESVCNL